MLALKLRTLEEDGLVVRRDSGEVPPRVEYALSEMGRDLARHLGELGRWVANHMPRILEARTAHHMRRRSAR